MSVISRLKIFNYQLIIRYIMGVLACTYLIYVILNSVQEGRWSTSAFDNLNYLGLFAAFLLMPLNWALEIIKWRELLKPIYDISFRNAIRAVTTGITVGFFTINRIGEWGGRILFIPAEKRVLGGVSTIIASFSQLIVTIMIGGLAFTYLLFNTSFIQGFGTSAVISAIGLMAGLLLLLYFLLPVICEKYIKRWLKDETFNLNHSLLNHALGWSTLRYIVFSVQYLLLLNAFNIHLSIIQELTGVSAVFFIQTVVPTLSFLELGVRGAGAAAVFSIYNIPEIPVVSAAFTLWIMNLIIPAAAGGIFLLFRPGQE